ncbi:solute carrier family 43 member 3-like, partial [Scyliorhinus canicula]|uniref:solute carrier family 43 member 3-like n=1 Tax=Scyliorhinus canicula TaxID=7830 RepID=UPI0018F38641
CSFNHSLIPFVTASAVLLFPAVSFLTTGGTIFILTNIQVGSLFGRKRSTVITLHNGAFISAAIVFLLVKVLYEAGLSLKSMFLFISCLSSIHLLRTFFLLPRTSIPYHVPDGYTYGLSCAKMRLMLSRFKKEAARERRLQHGGDQLEGESQDTREDDGRARQEEREGDTGEREEEIEKRQAKEAEDPKGNEEEIPSFRRCIFSKIFLSTLLWLSILRLRHNLFIGTLNPMLTLLAEEQIGKVSRLLNAFAITQICSIILAPWNGLIMDRHKRKTSDTAANNPEFAASDRLADMKSAVLSLTITVTQSILFSICATIPVLEVQYLTFILQVINNTFLYGCYVSFIAIAFPDCHFGKVCGLGLSFSAVFALLQYPFFALVQGPLKDDPLYLNIGLIALVTLTYVHPINVYLQCQREARQSGGAKAFPC